MARNCQPFRPVATTSPRYLNRKRAMIPHFNMLTSPDGHRFRQTVRYSEQRAA